VLGLTSQSITWPRGCDKGRVRLGHYAAVLIAALALGAAAPDQGQIIGNGRVVSEERAIAPASAINIDGAFEVAIIAGQTPRLILEGDENILAIVETPVRQDRLETFANRSYSANRMIKVTVSLPQLANLAASGSNRIEATKLTGSAFSVSLEGANSATLAGRVGTLTCRANGSNRVSAQELVADAVNISIAGAGDAHVDARQRIIAEIAGAGSIAVSGNPRDRQSRVNGSGRITFAHE